MVAAECVRAGAGLVARFPTSGADLGVGAVGAVRTDVGRPLKAMVADDEGNNVKGVGRHQGVRKGSKRRLQATHKRDLYEGR